MDGPVRKSLGLDDIPIKWGEQSEAVFQAVKVDFMKPVTESVERLLNETSLEVTVYNGQLDLIASTPGIPTYYISILFYKTSISGSMQQQKAIFTVRG